MPRSIDFRAAPLTELNLINAFDRLFAELAFAASYPTGVWDGARFAGLHLGADINAAIDRVDAAINSAAALIGKSSPANGSRVENFTTGTHDTTRLHAELDRLHGRIAAIASRSVVDAILPNRPFFHYRQGKATHANLSGAFVEANDGVPRLGLPWLPVRRNLVANSEFRYGFSGWNTISGTPTIYIADPKSYLRLKNSGTNVLVRHISNAGIPASSSTVYTLSFKYKSMTGGNSSFYFAFGGRTSGNVLSGGAVDQAMTATPTEQTKTFTITTGADAVKIWLDFYNYNNGSDVLITDVQVELGSVATTYQPTNATGLEVASLSGGILLEGTGTNLCINNVFANHTGWQSTRTPRVIVPALLPGKANALQAPVQFQYDTFETLLNSALTPGAVYTASMLLMSDVDLPVWFQNISLNDSIQAIDLKAGVIQEVVVTFTAGASGTRYGLKTRSAVVANVTIDALQIEPGPIRTSLILTDGAPGVRQPDILGFASPHNYVPDSDNAARSGWSVSYPQASDTLPNGRPGLSTQISSGSASHYSNGGLGVGQQAGYMKRWYTSVWVRAESGTATAEVRPEILGAGGANTNVVTVDTTWRRIALDGWNTGLANATKPISILVRSVSGAIRVWGAQLVEGYGPGPYVRTGSMPILPSASPVLDPAFAQNGFVEWDAVNVPNVANTTAIHHFGAGAGFVGLYRFQWGSTTKTAVLTLIPADVQSSPGGYRDVGGIPDAFYTGKCRVRIEWTNYLLGGVRYMFHRLIINGVVYYQKNAAADLDATVWPQPDAGRFISAGNVYATISNVKIGLLRPPAGAIPAVEPLAGWNAA